MAGEARGITRADLTLYGLVAVLMLGLVATLGRVAQLQLSPSDRLRAEEPRHLTHRTAEARRGDLLDRRGRVISASMPAYRLVVDPTLVSAPFGPKLEAIASATGVEIGEVADRVVGAIAKNEHRRNEGRREIRYVRVGGVLEDWRAARAADLGLRGVALERVQVRERVANEEMAEIVGKVGWDGRGAVGMERRFERDLSASDGVMTYVRDAMGRPLWMEAEGYRPGRAGESVRLSIDLELQRIAQEELERGVEESDAAGGRVMIVAPQTGEVLAMTDVTRVPEDAIPFDAELANEMRRGGPWVRFRVVPEDTRAAVEAELGRIRCVEDVYEPGSTFKPFVWATLVERGVIDPGDTVDTEKGKWRTPYGRRIEDVAPRDEQTWHEALVNSSNIAMSKGVAELPFDVLRADIRAYGFGRPVGLGLQGEEGGLVTRARDWTKYTQTSVSFGYEIGVTVSQMVRAFCVFAREGVLAGTLPRLSLGAVEGPEAWRTYERVFSPATAAETRSAMAAVGAAMVENFYEFHPGEAPVGVDLFGKSGTAKRVRPDGRGYLERQYTSSFIAGAPVEDPRLVVLVVIDDPGPERRAQLLHYGSMSAGPVVCRIVRRAEAYMGGPAVVGQRDQRVAISDEDGGVGVGSFSP